MPEDNDLQMWKDRIRNGQRFQIQFAGLNDWEKYKRYYRHKFKEETVPVNMVFSILRSMVPQVYFRNPKVVVTPRGYADPYAEINARIVQQIDNWLLNELGTKNQIKRMIADAFICGTASGFVGYDAVEYGKNKDRIEFDVGVKEGMPWFLRCRPEDVVYPWGSTSTANLPWVAYRIFKPVKDVQADSRYSNHEGLHGSLVPTRTYPEGASAQETGKAQESGKDVEWVELWQIHDAREHKILALTMDHDKFLRNDEDDDQVEGVPVETLVFNPDNDYIYGVPDAKIIEPQLLELIDIRTQSMKHRRVNLIRTLGKKGVISQPEIQKLMSENVQPYIEVETEGDIRAAIAPWSPGVSGILQDLALQGQIVQGDVRESVGFSRVAQGEYQGKTHVSAKETEQVYRSLNIRLDERRDLIADLIINIVRRWNQYIFKHWGKEQVAQIVGPDGAKYWVKFTGKRLIGEYDYSTEVEEAQPLNTEAKLGKAVEAAKAWAMMNQGAVKMGAPVPVEIQKAVFRNIEGINMDRLVAQLEATNKGAQAAQMQQAGQTPETAVNPADLVQPQG